MISLLKQQHRSASPQGRPALTLAVASQASMLSPSFIKLGSSSLIDALRFDIIVMGHRVIAGKGIVSSGYFIFMIVAIGKSKYFMMLLQREYMTYPVQVINRISQTTRAQNGLLTKIYLKPWRVEFSEKSPHLWLLVGKFCSWSTFPTSELTTNVSKGLSIPSGRKKRITSLWSNPYYIECDKPYVQ